jgi:hypothetical protein
VWKWRLILKTEERRAWNSRPTETRTLTRCDECGELKEDPDVQERKSYWPTFTVVSCHACFTRLIGEYQSAVAC